MKTTERNYAWYVMDEKEGILSYIDNPKLTGIEPYQDDGAIGFYPFDTIPEGTEITNEDVCCDYYEIEKGGAELVYAEIINAENKQHKMRAFAEKECAEDSLYESMLLVDTDRYYNWTSDRTRFIDSQSEKETTKEEAKAEWDEICSEYKGKNHFSEAPDFEEIWETIDYNRNK